MSLTSIDLGLREMLRDPQRRQEFFKAITKDEIASQIRDLRKKRALTQSAFARLAEMKQSAVSRIEQADYSSWSLTTLLRVADALNARWRITLQPAEEAVQEYEQMKRKHINLRTRLASALLAIGHIPRDDAKSLTEDQIISLYHFDHIELHAFTQNDAFWNLDPKLINPHREKSKRDTAIVAKARRIDKKWTEFTSNILAKPHRLVKHKWPKRKFQKRLP